MAWLRGRWENSLIGWTSSADSLEQAAEQHLYFKSLESAMAFCHRQGWAYDVAGEKAIGKQRPKRFLGYGDNFRRAMLSKDATSTAVCVALVLNLAVALLQQRM